MPVLWETDVGGTAYSVRSHGATIRLYSNGVFHSQWNPDKPFNGGIWDCLSLPVLYRQPGVTKRILLLGLGGGAVVQQLSSLVPFDCLTAVEIDALHIDIARRWFDVDDERVELVHDDAIAWASRYNGERFDLIIDDLFGHEQGEPVRAAPLSAEWLDLLRFHLDDSGLLIVNSVDARQLKMAASTFADVGFRYGYRWTLPSYENAIGVFSQQSLKARDWSRHLELSGLSASAQKQARATQRRPLRGLQ